MINERGRAREFPEVTTIERRDANIDSGAQGVQFCGFVEFPTFDEAKPLAHNLAGVLIAPTLHQGLNERFLPLRQDDIPCRHEITPQSRGL
jgi:hypothetical protein